jgi:hypothetical protein
VSNEKVPRSKRVRPFKFRGNKIGSLVSNVHVPASKEPMNRSQLLENDVLRYCQCWRGGLQPEYSWASNNQVQVALVPTRRTRKVKSERLFIGGQNEGHSAKRQTLIRHRPVESTYVEKGVKRSSGFLNKLSEKEDLEPTAEACSGTSSFCRSSTLCLEQVSQRQRRMTWVVRSL